MDRLQEIQQEIQNRRKARPDYDELEDNFRCADCGRKRYIEGRENGGQNATNRYCPECETATRHDWIGGNNGK